MNDSATTAADHGLSISSSAANRIAKIKEMERNAALMLRVSVSGGGCSGFQYGFALDDKVAEDDRVFEENGVQVVIDETSLEILAGSQVDFVEDLGASYFAMKNPHAKSVCGCGTSFSI